MISLIDYLNLGGRRGVKIKSYYFITILFFSLRFCIASYLRERGIV
jgi:hypothetical protein